MFHLAPISTRNQFGPLLLQMGLTEAAVEVGTHRGAFARVLLEQWPGTLVCIDPWSVPPGYEAQSAHLSGPWPSTTRLHATPQEAQEMRNRDYWRARERLDPYADRVTLLRGLSLQAATVFPPGSLDFVYLDGDHTRPAIDQDLSTWWERVRPGGLLAGHDFLCPGEVKGGWGQYIQPAVLDHATRHQLDVYLVAEENGQPWSYYFIKPLTLEGVEGTPGE